MKTAQLIWFIDSRFFYENTSLDKLVHLANIHNKQIKVIIDASAQLTGRGYWHLFDNIEPLSNEVIIELDKKQHPEQSYKSCLGILHFAKKVGNTRLNNACKRALNYQAYNYKIIERILEKGWDAVEEPTEEITEVPYHNNIRGRNYYK